MNHGHIGHIAFQQTGHVVRDPFRILAPVPFVIGVELVTVRLSRTVLVFVPAADEVAQMTVTAYHSIQVSPVGSA